jgi:chorismate mutase / prephenate dehydrogenase
VVGLGRPMTKSRRPLRELRREIERVDRTLAATILQRLALAREVGRTKASLGQPLRDYGVEKSVLSRWQRGLARAGVRPARAQAVGRWLVEEALRVQEAESSKRAPSSGRVPPDVAVVGGAGGMGRWLVEFLQDSGHEVAVVDPASTEPGRPTFPDIETAARVVKVLAFATPIRATAPLLRRAMDTGTRALIFDVLSVKAPISPLLTQAARAGLRVTSTHPLFGPSARTLSGRNLLIVSCGVPGADRAARALFARSALTITEVPLDRHDLLIAESLGMSHAVNLLFMVALGAEPVSSHDLARAASTTFHRQSSLAAAVASEGPELYLDIQSLNPHSWSMYEELRTALDRLAAVVERQDGNGFREILAAGQAKLQPGEPSMRQ